MKKSISTDLTPANITAALDILGHIPNRLEQLGATLTPAQFRQPLGDGERSFIENVAHLINCESRSAETIIAALTLTDPMILSIHPERQYGNLLRLEELDYADLLTYFKFRRLVLMRVLHSLTDAQWQRVVSAEGKARKESVYWQVRGLALHESEHLTDMETKVRVIFGGG